MNQKAANPFSLWGIPRHIQYFGEPNTAIQPSDVMVLLDVRRHYGKSSFFFKTAATFLEREIGNTVNHLFGVWVSQSKNYEHRHSTWAL
ncbi:MAG: hypothetical protein Ct9H300mP22_7490 [Gammaproteobacteria bacterium]|nr:MAG: hypothetical protein Ct9H300mP22_7490 [Gammaproteobacteria bacterium]